MIIAKDILRRINEVTGQLIHAYDSQRYFTVSKKSTNKYELKKKVFDPEKGWFESPVVVFKTQKEAEDEGKKWRDTK